MKSREELMKEVEALRKKLSPLEDKEFTREFLEAAKDADFEQYTRNFRGAPHIVLDPQEVWRLVFGTEPNKHDIMVLGRTLQALMWERSALSGARIFVKTLEEYRDETYR